MSKLRVEQIENLLKVINVMDEEEQQQKTNLVLSERRRAELAEKAHLSPRYVAALLTGLQAVNRVRGITHTQLE